MTARRLLGGVPLAALIVCGWTACKEGGDSGKSPGNTDLVARCEQLGKACSDGDKHAQKVVAECEQAAARPVASKCAQQIIATYDCYLKELCGKGDKVWALDDLRVLSDRHGRCMTEREAARTCVGK